jgi:predicted nucleic acid-binding protein
MIRVVLDTNIVISALLQPQGLPARTFLIALAGTTAQLCVSAVSANGSAMVLSSARMALMIACPVTPLTSVKTLAKEDPCRKRSGRIDCRRRSV